jgi:hypothetical protein
MLDVKESHVKRLQVVEQFSGKTTYPPLPPHSELPVRGCNFPASPVIRVYQPDFVLLFPYMRPKLSLHQGNHSAFIL